MCLMSDENGGGLTSRAEQAVGVPDILRETESETGKKG